MTSALILLTYDEIDSLRILWDRIKAAKVDRILAVDAGSTDGTLEFYREVGCECLIQTRKGRGQAFRDAAHAVKEDILIFCSPDGNENIEDIPKLIKLIEDGCDLAIASRTSEGAVNEEDGHWWRPRKWVNIAFNIIANVLFNKPWRKGKAPFVTDTINGFRAFKRESFLKLNTTETGYPIEYQTTIRSLKKGYRIGEFPTYEGQRLGGVSGCSSFPTGLRYIWRLWRELGPERGM